MRYVDAHASAKTRSVHHHVPRRHNYYGARRVAAILRACFFGCYPGCYPLLSYLEDVPVSSAAIRAAFHAHPALRFSYRCCGRWCVGGPPIPVRSACTLAFSKLILVERAPGAALFELILLRGHLGVGQLFPIYWSAGCLQGVMAIMSHKSTPAPCCLGVLHGKYLFLRAGAVRSCT